MTLTDLHCRAISVHYGAFVALKDVSLEFPRGRIISIIGPNGAGKTTLVNALAGTVAPTKGDVMISGRNVNRLAPHRRARLGLGRSFQIVNIFRNMTVTENLELAAQAHCFRMQPFWWAASGYASPRTIATEILSFTGLEPLADHPAETLSHGNQRALELGLTLVGNPSILLLDEPMAGVGHDGIENMMKLISTASAGRTVVLIEHNMDVVMTLSHEIVVMAGGSVLAKGSPDEIRSDASVRNAYLGEG